jgi:benzoate membrane transport protein
VVSRISAGFVAVLVGYTSSVAIVFQAAHAAGASPEMVSSWLWALGMGMGITCIGLSWWTKEPILTAWSTPGAALLAGALPGLSLPETIGVFILASGLITLTGFLGAFDRVMRHIPMALAAAMLAGVLLRFGIGAFEGLQTDTLLIAVMFGVFLITKRFASRYAVPITLLTGLLWLWLSNGFTGTTIAWQWATPVFTAPSFSWESALGVAVPLYVVTMASQNVPGLSVLRANGYKTPISPLLKATGLTGLVLGPFGGFQYNLAAITAAICMSPDADPDATKRYQAAMWAGAFYIALGLLGATVASLFAALPPAFVMAIAGLALLPTIANSLHQALQDPTQREAAVVTFLVSASGVNLLGIASAFWGLLLGLLTARILMFRTQGT